MTERFENDLRRSLGDQINNDEIACDLWCALANISWHHLKTQEEAEYTHRAAANLIDELRGGGDDREWYLCGPPGVVSDHISQVMKQAGWTWREM